MLTYVISPGLVTLLASSPKIVETVKLTEVDSFVCDPQNWIYLLWLTSSAKSISEKPT